MSLSPQILRQSPKPIHESGTSIREQDHHRSEPKIRMFANRRSDTSWKWRSPKSINPIQACRRKEEQAQSSLPADDKTDPSVMERIRCV